MSTGGDGPGRQSRWVLHVDMDAFFASCEQLTRPTLRGRAVLVGGTGGRGVVAGCSYEARARGARSAMPMHQARKLVGPAAVVLPPRMAVYREASARVVSVMRELMPVIEQISVDEAYLEPVELRGATVDEVRQWAEDFRRQVLKNTGLAASVGAGAGKQYAKIASDLAKPDGVHIIARRDHATALDPLPVRRLWGVGPVAGEKLTQLGITTIGQLAAAEDAEITRVLGLAVGTAILHVARGFDDRPVVERAEAKQISSESTFAEDLRTVEDVGAAVRRLARHAHRRLLADGRYARTVTVKVKRADFQSITRSTTLLRGTVSLELMVATALQLAPDPLDFGAIRLLGVGLSGLVEESQGLLFGEEDSSVPSVQGSESAPDEADEADRSQLGEHAPGGDVVRWRPGADVRHSEFGFGWVQGAGHGRVTIRFESRATGPGRARTFAEDDKDLRVADPVESLDW